MTRPLRILFATGHPDLPQIAGGLQASTDESMKALIARGQDARLLCGLTGAGGLGRRHRVVRKLGAAPAYISNSRFTRARIRTLPNVTLVPRTTDMAAIYARARILLVPSQWEEAFSRVVVEAQFSGIPALANQIGGLPEAVGNGGLLLPADAPPRHWAAALRRIWDDPAEHARLSRTARAHLTASGVLPPATGGDAAAPVVPVRST